MLRPSFKKYFQEDNFSEPVTTNEDDVEPCVDVKPDWTPSDSSSTKEKGDDKKSESTDRVKDDPGWDSDRSIYEMQLNQLQEQLVETMVENQQLGEELRQLKEKGRLEQLSKELEEEKKKNRKLEERLKKMRPKRPPDPNTKEKRNSGEHAHTSDGWEDLTSVADSTIFPESVLLASGVASVNSIAFAGALPSTDTPDLDQVNASKANLEKPATEEVSKFVAFKIKAWNCFHDRISDFFNDEAADNEAEQEEEPLAIKTLRENVSRFTDGILPIRRFVAAFRHMLNWKNPWFSLSAFVIYLYSIWLGCFIPLVLLIAITKLSFNYMYAKGIAQKFGYHDKSSDSEEDKAEVTSWSERYQLVLQIARKVQNTLGNLADTLEKFESLFTWRHDEASGKLYLGLWVAFLATLILPSRYFYLPFGFGIGIKLFIVSPIYKRFPKVQKRYDNIDRLWNELPTREQAPVQRAKSNEIDLNIDATHSDSPTMDSNESKSRSPSRVQSHSRNSSIDADRSGAMTWGSIVFCERFHLPQTEVQLAGWEDGRRCTLLNKESPLSNMKHGRLYLTKNYLCFERNQYHSKKNFAIRLHDILEIQKSKPFSFLPGGGMSIEVTTKTNEKPFMFGAMMGRDEAYESILRAGRALNLSWGRKS